MELGSIRSLAKHPQSAITPTRIALAPTGVRGSSTGGEEARRLCLRAWKEDVSRHKRPTRRPPRRRRHQLDLRPSNVSVDLPYPHASPSYAQSPRLYSLSHGVRSHVSTGAERWTREMSHLFDSMCLVDVTTARSG